MDWYKRQCIKISEYIPKPYKHFWRNFNVKVDLPNHATQWDFKTAAGVHTSNFAAKSASLKLEIDKFGVDKSKATPVELRKVGNVVNNDVVKKSCLWQISYKSK